MGVGASRGGARKLWGADAPLAGWGWGARTVGFSMFSIDSGMLVEMTCTFCSFFSMCAASQILPSGPFFASTYWE